jgi:hypothetical protein
VNQTPLCGARAVQCPEPTTGAAVTAAALAHTPHYSGTLLPRPPLTRPPDSSEGWDTSWVPSTLPPNRISSHCIVCRLLYAMSSLLCSECGYTAMRRGDLERHRLRKHDDAVSLPPSSACEHCHATFSREADRDRHLGNWRTACPSHPHHHPPKRRRVKLERYTAADATTARGCPIAVALKAAFGPNHRFVVETALDVRCRDCDRSLWVGKTKTGAIRLDGLERHLERVHARPPPAVLAEGRRVDLDGHRAHPHKALERLNRDRFVVLDVPPDVRSILEATARSGDFARSKAMAKPLSRFDDDTNPDPNRSQHRFGAEHKGSFAELDVAAEAVAGFLAAVGMLGGTELVSPLPAHQLRVLAIPVSALNGAAFAFAPSAAYCLWCTLCCLLPLHPLPLHPLLPTASDAPSAACCLCTLCCLLHPLLPAASAHSATYCL